ncbi:uncharacterized protein NKAPD1-like [Dermacentor andersoni]|uniref:uncharacterized protein NKAPD1-like n=1 Tax=Dermacentor andersoni TaxID=34620 RepID=UPI0021559631|nr:uncharacterized protein NKAPD1-like [Dermacentor andersoni]
MFTRAAKELLRNTISSVDHHNRVLEEQEMWRQWELEKGLTMMVSDETLRARQHHTRTPKQSSKRRRSPQQPLPAVSSSSQDRWGHSGYRELYPEEFSPPRIKRRRRSSSHHKRKSRHRKSHHKKASCQEGRRSRSRHRHQRRDSSTSSSSSSDNSSNSNSSDSTSSSDAELVWEERKT